MSTDQKEVIALGVTAEEFLASPIGRHIMGQALVEASAAAEKMRLLNSNKKEFKAKFDEHQNTINRHEDLDRWMKEIIDAGRMAYEQYKVDFEEGNLDG